MQTDDEIYPMPLFVRLTVSDLEESTAWYRRLGFDVIYSMPAMTHVRYRKYADIMLATTQVQPGGEQPGGDGTQGRGVSIYINLDDESVDDVTERASERGAELSESPRDTPWNTREISILDPDGYELVFSEPIDTDRTFEDVVDASNRNRHSS